MTLLKIQSYESFDYSKYGLLTRLDFQRRFLETDESLVDLELELANHAQPTGNVLIITAKRVSDLKIGNLNSGETILLMIRDISSYGLEFARYRVKDEEANVLEFNCCDFDFSLRSQ